MTAKSLLKKLMYALASVAVLIQLVPYGRQHENPPVRQEPQWDSATTRELIRRTCFDCHSNETVWPWYSHVAPVSWLVQRDVEAGRRHLNFSEWDRPQRHAKDAPDEVRNSAMPLPIYLPLHAEARLSKSEKQTLIDGLEAIVKRPVSESDETEQAERE